MQVDLDELYADLVAQGEYLGQHPLDTFLAIERHLWTNVPGHFKERVWAHLQNRGYYDDESPWPRETWARWLRN